MSSVIGRLWKSGMTLLAAAGLAGMLWSYNIWYQYQRTLPRHLDQTAGRIYPLNVHGIVVYQTSQENHWRQEIQYSSLAALLACGVMSLVYQKTFARPPL
jgi:hypothetical protein